MARESDRLIKDSTIEQNKQTTHVETVVRLQRKHI